MAVAVAVGRWRWRRGGGGGGSDGDGGGGGGAAVVASTAAIAQPDTVKRAGHKIPMTARLAVQPPHHSAIF